MSKHRAKLRKTKDLIAIYWETAVVFSVLIAGILLTYLYQKTTTTPGPIISGLLTGCVLLFVQLVFDLQKSKELSKLKKMRIKSIIPYREGKMFYKLLIEDTSNSIDVAGTTISRFLTDFAHHNRADSQSLLHALDHGTNVRFLIPSDEFLCESDMFRVQDTIRRVNEINAENRKGKISIKRFKHAPAHSLFIADEDCLIGPVFPGISSKDSPAIHTTRKSEFAKPYLDYFKKEWTDADPI